jgi:hypothetical protein
VEGDFRRGFGVGSMGTGVGFDRGLKMLLSQPLFFGFADSVVACARAASWADASANFPWTIVPETRLETRYCVRGTFDPVSSVSSGAYHVSVP